MKPRIVVCELLLLLLASCAFAQEPGKTDPPKAEPAPKAEAPKGAPEKPKYIDPPPEFLREIIAFLGKQANIDVLKAELEQEGKRLNSQVPPGYHFDTGSSKFVMNEVQQAPPPILAKPKK